MADLMTAEEIKGWILRRVGAPFLKVELTADHLEDALQQAKRWFAAKKGVKRMTNMVFTSGIQEYKLDDDIDTVLDVSFPGPQMDLSLVFSPYILADEKVPYDVFAAPSSLGLYSSYEQTIQYIDMAKRILGADADWRQEGRNLLIFPNPKASGTMIVEYKSHNFTIEQLNERDHDLVKRYALAFAKKDLSEVRGKYTEWAGAQGMTTLNYAKLAADADKEMEQLEKEIALSAMPMGLMIG